MPLDTPLKCGLLIQSVTLFKAAGWLLQFLLKAETPDFEDGGGGKGGRKEGEGHQNPKACFK